MAGFLLGAGACSTLPVEQADPGQETTSSTALSAACVEDFAGLERLAGQHGIYLSDPRSVPGFPGLATRRWLGAVDVAALTAGEREDWHGRLVALGRERRAIQLHALAARDADGPSDSADRLEKCERFLSAPASDDAWKALQEAARVPDDYRFAARALGLYPLVRFPVSRAVRRLQDELTATFADEESAKAPAPPAVQAVVYHPVPSNDRATVTGSGDGLRNGPRDGPHDAPRNGLAVHPHKIDPSDLMRMLERHAPVLQILESGDFDRPGAPIFDSDDQPRVVGDEPVAYTYFSFMPFDGELRLQLNYLFWFDRRPSAGPLDSLAGRLDGVLWRVTLDESGRALVYDSVHACGCYHMLFPGAGLKIREEAAALPEPPLVPRPAPVLEDGQRMVLSLASGSHYLQGISRVARDPQPTERSAVLRGYRFRPYADLYAVSSPGGPTSLFDRRGLIPGTARGERFYLWPMGVRSPGAMRERGRQATAFVGRRHFDDGDLLDLVFQRVTAPASSPGGSPPGSR